MALNEQQKHVFSMQHLLTTPLNCSTVSRMPLQMHMPMMMPIASDVLDLSRKRGRSPTPPNSPVNSPTQSPTHSIESHRLTPEQKHYPDPPHAMMCFSSPSSQAGSESSETSHMSDRSESMYQYQNDATSIENKNKLPRPFKAYPKDPLSLAYGVVNADAIISKDSAGAYAEFRSKMLSRVQNQNQGTNIKMRRTTHQNATGNADPTYWEKRRKNNEAAKRSRDARRAKEDEIAIRCAFLEQENLKLRFEMTSMRHEMERMRGVLNVPSY